MQFFSLLALIIFLVPDLITLAARVPHNEHREIETVAILAARDEPTRTTETAAPTSDDGTATATATATTGDASNSSSTSTPSATESAASTTISSLDASSTSENEKPSKKPSPGEIPLKPIITPALGVGGFILIVLGAILALIGIRNLRVQVFLSTSFLTSLGVTVLIIYVMNPPVSNAIQGAYLVAVFFSGITFGALSIVFKELTEGLGCFLGGFCSSMWLLCLKPGGLITQASPKSGFIAAISVAFYALSFSHYTRPHGLIASTAIAGGTAVALGVDCFSRAGLKEFWLYNWALNDKIFPLDTNTYPITRNIRVELAVTVIVALLGIVSQLRLWKVIRRRRRNEAKIREEEKKKNDEAEAEAGRQLEENNSQQRAEWEARYGNGEAKPASPEVQDESKQCDVDGKEVDLEKGETVEVNSVAELSEKSYRCSDCREREANGDDISEKSFKPADDNRSQHHDKIADEQPQDPSSDQTPKDEPPIPVFDGAAAARVKDDNQSEVSAILGSEVGTTRSKRFTRMSLVKQMSVSSSLKPASRSQEALVWARGDAASNTSAEGVMDEDSVLNSRRSSILSEGNDWAKDDDAKSAPKESNESPAVENPTEQKPPEMKEPSQEQGTDRKKEPDQEAVQKEEHNTLEIENAVEKPALPTEDTRKEPTVDEQKQLEEQQPQTEQQAQTAQSVPSERHSAVDPVPESSHETGKKPQLPDNVNGPPDASKQEVEKLVEESQEPGAKASAKDSGSNYSRAENQGKEFPVESKPSRESSRSSKSKRSPVQKDRTKADTEKEEKVTLNADTVKHIPERTSKIVQSYRTNEWAKHLDDAEIPEPPPIQPIEEEQPAVPAEADEVVAPVNVKELLQTPLNAQPPPVIERKELRTSNEGPRMSHDSQARQTDVHHSNSLVKQPQPAVVSPTSNSDPRPGPLPAQPAPAAPQKEQEKKPKWKGPPPLLALREDLMRNRLSSTSLSIDPWPSRMSPRQSTFGTPPISPTSPIPEDGDNVPLSQRRAMLQQQTAQAPRANPSPAPPQRTRPGVSGQGQENNAQAAMAAWRHSVQEDLRQKRDPQHSLGSGMSTSPVERSSSSSPYAQPQWNRSSMNLHVENAVAEGMQRGDMTDLHREAMRRMQASANRKT